MNFFKKLFSGSKSQEPSELETNWNLYKDWIHRKLPLYHTYFNAGASDEELAQLKSNFPFELPAEILELYKLNNGDSSIHQDIPLGTFMQFEFLSISRVISEYNNFKEIVSNNPELLNSEFYKSFPENTIRKVYFSNYWIPLFSDGSGNYVGVDLSPDVNGVTGQIINFGRDEDLKFQIAKSFNDLLLFIQQRIQSGSCDPAIVEEDDGEYSYGLSPQSHFLDDLRHIIVEGRE